MRNFSFIFVLAFGLFACTSHTFGVDDQDATSGDAVSGDSSGRRDDTALPTSGKSCQNRCGNYSAVPGDCQCDEKCVAAGDCCGDHEKFCPLNSPAPTADAGSNTSPEVAQTNCVDKDGDGYCDSTAKLPGDCNDNNGNIHPGADECKADGTGNGVDDNCNGVVDEGCKAAATTTTTTTTATSGNNSLTVKYADSASRRLSYGVTSDVSSIPYVWTIGSWQTSDTFTVDLGNLQTPSSKCLYVRLNVDEPNSKWLCMANQINAAANITLNAFGKTYGTSSAQKISLGGGCSVIYAIAFDGATCPIP